MASQEDLEVECPRCVRGQTVNPEAGYHATAEAKAQTRAVMEAITNGIATQVRVRGSELGRPDVRWCHVNRLITCPLCGGSSLADRVEAAAFLLETGR